MSGPDIVFLDAEPTWVFKMIVARPHECGRLMTFLTNPESPAMMVYDYVATMKGKFKQRNVAIKANPSHAGHDAFEKIAIDSGIVETLFKIAKDRRKSMEYAVIANVAVEGIWELMLTGKANERRELIHKFLALGIVDYWVQTAESGFFVAHRMTAMAALRVMVVQGFLAEHLSIQKTSEIMKTCLKCLLSGPNVWKRQMKDPATTWQSMYCIGSLGVSTAKARQYAPRYYAMYQDHAVWIVIELASTLYPIPEQEHYNKLMKHDPGVIHLLFKCAQVKREAWYPQLAVDGFMVATLVLLVNFPAEMVPGVELQVEDDEILKRIRTRWEGVMEGVDLITECPRWCQMIIDVWKNIEGEDIDAVLDMIALAQKDYSEPFDPKEFPDVIRGRGMSRVAILRLITTIAYASERPKNNVSDLDLLNLLMVSQRACQFVESEKDAAEANCLKASTKRTERCHSAWFQKPREPEPGLFTGTEDAILQISDEMVTGPTCHFRILVALAKRGLLEKIQEWDVLPEGLDVAGELPAMKELVSEEEIKRCLALSLSRISERREIGNVAFKRGNRMDGARYEYWSGAQLAAVVIEFDEITDGRYHKHVRGARKELVLILGNAAEMAIGERYFDRALVFASAAVRLAEAGLSSEEPVGEAVREKNQRRVDRARAGIQAGRL